MEYMHIIHEVLKHKDPCYKLKRLVDEFNPDLHELKELFKQQRTRHADELNRLLMANPKMKQSDFPSIKIDLETLNVVIDELDRLINFEPDRVRELREKLHTVFTDLQSKHYPNVPIAQIYSEVNRCMEVAKEYFNDLDIGISREIIISDIEKYWISAQQHFVNMPLNANTFNIVAFDTKYSMNCEVLFLKELKEYFTPATIPDAEPNKKKNRRPNLLQFEELFRSHDCVVRILAALHDLNLINSNECWIGNKNKIGTLYDVLTQNGYFSKKWPEQPAVTAIAERFQITISERQTRERPVNDKDLRKEMRSKLPSLP